MTTYHGRVENGQLVIREQVALPEQTEFYLVVPDSKTDRVYRIASPRLVHPEQAVDFEKEVELEPDDSL